MFAIYNNKPYLIINNGFREVKITQEGYIPGKIAKVKAKGRYLHFEILAKLGVTPEEPEEPDKKATEGK